MPAALSRSVKEILFIRKPFPEKASRVDAIPPCRGDARSSAEPLARCRQDRRRAWRNQEAPPPGREVGGGRAAPTPVGTAHPRIAAAPGSTPDKGEAPG